MRVCGKAGKAARDVSVRGGKPLTPRVRGMRRPPRLQRDFSRGEGWVELDERRVNARESVIQGELLGESFKVRPCISLNAKNDEC